MRQTRTRLYEDYYIPEEANALRCHLFDFLLRG